MQVKDWKNKIEKISLDILWSHWIKMGAYVSGPVCQASCDPEALIVITAIMGPKDQRLIEVMSQWLYHYESVINIERLKNVLKLSADQIILKKISDLLLEILQKNIPKSSKKRWENIVNFLKPYLDPSYQNTLLNSDPNIQNRKKLQSHEWIIDHNPLLHFRYLFGASAKADILYFIRIYQNQPRKASDSPATGALIARFIHSNPATVHRALEELKKSLVVKKNEANQIYSINPDSLLRLENIKTDSFFVDWFSWVSVFKDVLFMDEDLLNHHDSVVISRLNKRIQYLFNLFEIGKKMDINLPAVKIKEMWPHYFHALKMWFDSLIS